MSSISYYISYLSNLYFGYPIVIRIAVFFVYALVFSYLFVILRMYLFVRNEKKEAERLKSVKDRFERKLEDILSVSNNLSREEVEDVLGVEESQLKSWEKKWLTDLILAIKSSHEGFNSHNFKHVVRTLDLVRFWEQDMEKDNFDKNRKALDVLDEFDESVTGSSFTRKINSSDDDLRKLMKTEYIRFATNDAFSFLEGDFDRSFNNLDALRIHGALKERAKMKQLPVLMRWVQTSKNEDYQAFLINEIALFNQLESGPHLMRFYEKTTSDKLKAAIAKTLGELKFEDAIPVLSRDYNFVTNRVQFSIVSALGNIGTNDAYMALEHIYTKTFDNEMMVAIFGSMYKIDPEKTLNFIERNEQHNAVEEKMLGYMQHQELAVA